jgi:hypothetical protein
VWSGKGGGGVRGVGGRGGGSEVASASSGSLQVLLHIVGLHVECDETVLNQVHDGVKWLLTNEMALLLGLIEQSVVSHLTLKHKGETVGASLAQATANEVVAICCSQQLTGLLS